MGKRPHALLFILVNIIVSVSTTLFVLWLWERAHSLPEAQLPNPPADFTNAPIDQNLTAGQEPDTESTLLRINQDIQVAIRTIVGAGDLDVEYVEIINQGPNPADLSDWKLIDEDGHQFNFPALILNSGGAIKVLSKTGTNTVIELFWQADAPIWGSGETARLLDASDEMITSYSIP